jgi:hypothetical protein
MDYLQTILGLFSTILNNPLIIYKPSIDYLQKNKYNPGMVYKPYIDYL